jgi:hypothetical protein
MVEDVPAQIVEGAARLVTFGFGFTVMVMLAVPVHPPAVPVTVYVVVLAGATSNGFAVPRPPLHV